MREEEGGEQGLGRGRPVKNYKKWEVGWVQGLPAEVRLLPIYGVWGARPCARMLVRTGTFYWQL